MTAPTAGDHGAASSRRVGRFALHVAFLIAMVVGALLAEALHVPDTPGLSAWYPPAGFLLGYLVVAGWRWAPLAVVGRALAVVVVDPYVLEHDLIGLLVRTVAVVIVYAAVAAILRRVGVARLGVAEAAWLMALGLVIGPGVATLAYTGAHMWLSDGEWVREAVRLRWVGDSVAVASIVPVVVAAEEWWRGGRPTLNRRVVAESDQLAVALALVGVPIAAFMLASGDLSWYVPFALLPVFWVAFRSETVAATSGLLLTNILTAGVIRANIGPALTLNQAQMLMLSSASAGIAILAISVDQRRRVSELITREERYATLVEHSPATVIRFDATGQVVPIGVGSPPEDVVQGLRSQWEAFGPQTIESGGTRVIPWMAETADGVRFYVTDIAAEAAGEESGPSVLTVTSDVTASQEAEAEFSMRLRTDGLTGLANRSHVTAALDEALAREAAVGVAVVDLDDFAQVNRRLGYIGGDRVLVDVGNRLASCVRDADLVGRLGDDEFAVLLSDPIGSSDAGRVMDRILHEIRAVGPSHGLDVTVSIGVAFASPGVSSKQLLDDARAALDLRRGAGGDGWTVLDDELRSTLQRGRRLAAELRGAIVSDALSLAYQPVVDLTDRTVVGFEALVRWTRADGEPVTPDTFVPLAERVGLVGAITDRVLGGAIDQLAAWAAAGNERVHVSVNVSTADLLDPDFCERLLSRIRAAGVQPARLRLELTETAVLTDPDHAVEVLGTLRDAGFTIVLDDFGTGYSSLALLRSLPVDVLKIDQSFVVGLPGAADAAVVRLILGMAEALGVGVVAEGIETEEQLRFLQQAGCRVGQGYLFSRPQSAAELEGMVVPAAG